MPTDPSDIVTQVEGHIGSYMRLCEALGLDPIGYDSTQVQTLAADEIGRLRLRVKELTGAIIRTEAQLKNSASSLQAEAEKLFNASLEANEVSDPRSKND